MSLSALAIAGSWFGATAVASLHAQSLPDAPSTLLLASASGDASAIVASGLQQQSSSRAQNGAAPPPAVHPVGVEGLPPCPHQGLTGVILFLPGKVSNPCRRQNQLQTIVDAGPVRPLTVDQKGELAIRDFTDPFNFLTIAAFSGITVAANPHTAYGPGIRGFGRLAGYSLVGAAQGDFLGTYAIPVLTHEDPRYHRVPGRTLTHRITHALVHTFVTQHDNGSLMPNYSVLLGYPISAEISNLYVPGLQTNGSATVERIAIGIGTDPVGPLIAEFLPDLARHIHIHVIFMQQILNQVANGGTTP